MSGGSGASGGSAAPFIDANQSLAATWREEADMRRKRSRVDVGADILDACAAELLERTRIAQAAMHEDTLEDFARHERVSPATVRRWIRSGLVQGRKTAKGYVVARDQATPPHRRKSA